ncbi:MAG: diguanylate cyclase [Guyparkeria sp.]
MLLLCGLLLDVMATAAFASEQPLLSRAELALTDAPLSPREAMDLDFQALDGDSRNLGSFDGHIWLRLTLDETDLRTHGRWLFLRWPYFEDMRLYLLDPSAPGDAVEVLAGKDGTHRLGLSRDPGRELPEFTGERLLLVDVKSDGPAALALSLGTLEAERQRNLVRYSLFGIYLGAMLGMAVYSLFLMVAVRERTYLGYAAFLGSTVLYVGLQHNILTPFLPGFLRAFSATDRAQVAVVLMVVTAIWFVRRFLRTQQDDERLDRLLLAVTAVALFVVPVALLWHGMLPFAAVAGSGVVAMGAIIWASIRAIRRGFGPARFLLAGWTVFSLAVLLHLGLLAGLLPYVPWLLVVLPVGSLAEALLLAFALGDRIRHKQREEAMVVRERDRYRSLSEQDGLTGLFNRRALDRQLERSIADVQKTGRPLSVIVLDADHFKRYNDSYGHLAGDDILRCLARVMSNNVRREDRCFRYGGEEFVVVLPGKTLEQAASVAERIREVFRRHSASSQRPACTVSVGVAQCCEGDTPASLLARGDEALYRAKDLGRDRVERVTCVPARNATTVID